MFRLCVLVAILAAAVNAIPIDNGVTGDPEIECGPTSISITFNTQKAFSGHVYVKNLYAEPGCRTDGDNSRSVGQIELGFDKCNVQRTRSLNPKGVFVRSTVVISFHPNFITKVDRAYTIQCFYMEADKTVSTGIEVSAITTGFQTQLVPMPVCRYEILSAATGGQPVAFAIIGQPVFHKWTCDTDTVDTFCMTVHSCFVDDGQGDRLDLINDQGCALDKYLMGNLEYPTDLMGVKEVHVFKYADRPALQFQCQITILIKEPNAQCVRPQCAEPGGRGDGSAGGAAPAPAANTPAPAAGGATTARTAAAAAATTARAPAAAATTAATAPAGRKRRAVSMEENAAGTMDVAQSFTTLDIEEGSQTEVPSLFGRQASAPAFFDRPVVVRGENGNLCMSTTGFVTFLIGAVVLIGAIVTVTACLLIRREKY